MGIGLHHQLRHGKNRWNACPDPGFGCQKTDTSGKTGYRKEWGNRSCSRCGERLNSWNREYKEALGVRSIEQFQSEYFYKLPSNKRKYNSERCQIAKDNMINAMVEYKTEHDFGAAASLEGFPEFEAVYERLKNSELLDYEEKVQSAHKAAETEFHEQFLAKLQENMKLAQGEFKELNKALKGIDFSSERYEFQFMPSKKYRNYYEMIMDDFNVTQGESLFSGIFHEAHKDVIEELFVQLSVSRRQQCTGP